MIQPEPQPSLPRLQPRSIEAVRSHPLLGVPLSMTDYDEAIDVMDGLVESRERGYVCATPVHGPELMRRYSERCAERGHRVWLYGGRDQGSLVQLALSLRRNHPDIRIVGGYSPPFRPLGEQEEHTIAQQINEAKPDVLWVGIGVPKQEKWMAHMRDRVDVPVMCGVGAAFDFHAGRIPMAPRWMQDHGLEWVYRIYQEPGRLLPRYLYYNPRFVLSFARQYLAER
jgi:N-acetylglucosaminyldiphosphoundecaprenol N-acetyl-beta-D-mannosaminyltransferase